mgnify:FL=1
MVPDEARKRQGEKMKRFKGEKCWNWKGDNVGYGGRHRRIIRIKGSPKGFICSCGKKAIHWSNINHKYSLNPDDYIARCMSCHERYDFKMGFRHHKK